MEKKPITVGFIGNPNCGKTTLFNAFTGANLKVGNWPGVTVEKKEGKLRDKKNGEIEEVKWQEGLNKIAQNKKSFFQIDFSATPYETVGSGRNQKKKYFPHIVTDFDLTTAMRLGLVKTLLLDRRQDLTDLGNLDYKAVRDGRKVISLSEGQRLMLRAGLRKLQILEDGFKKVDEKKYIAIEG